MADPVVGERGPNEALIERLDAEVARHGLGRSAALLREAADALRSAPTVPPWAEDRMEALGIVASPERCASHGWPCDFCKTSAACNRSAGRSVPDEDALTAEVELLRLRLEETKASCRTHLSKRKKAQKRARDLAETLHAVEGAALEARVPGLGDGTVNADYILSLVAASGRSAVPEPPERVASGLPESMWAEVEREAGLDYDDLADSGEHVLWANEERANGGSDV